MLRHALRQLRQTHQPLRHASSQQMAAVGATAGLMGSLAGMGETQSGRTLHRSRRAAEAPRLQDRVFVDRSMTDRCRRRVARLSITKAAADPLAVRRVGYGERCAAAPPQAGNSVQRYERKPRGGVAANWGREYCEGRVAAPPRLAREYFVGSPSIIPSRSGRGDTRRGDLVETNRDGNVDSEWRRTARAKWIVDGNEPRRRRGHDLTFPPRKRRRRLRSHPPHDAPRHLPARRARHQPRTRPRAAKRNTPGDNSTNGPPQVGVLATGLAGASAYAMEGEVDVVAAAAVASTGARAAARKTSSRVRGTAAAATWIFRGDESRHRRGCHVDIPWRAAAAPRLPGGSFAGLSKTGCGFSADGLSTSPRVRRTPGKRRGKGRGKQLNPG